MFGSTSIWQSKTNPFGAGVTLYLGRTGDALCPVTSVLVYLALRQTTPGLLFIFMAHHFPVLILSQHSSRHCRWQGFTPLHTAATDSGLGQLWRLLRLAWVTPSLRCLAGGNQWPMPCTFDLWESVSCLFLWYSLGPSGEYAHKNISEVLPEITATLMYPNLFFLLTLRM